MINTSSLVAVTLSKSNELEMVIHIDDESDIHFSDPLKDELLEVLKFIHF